MRRLALPLAALGALLAFSCSDSAGDPRPSGDPTINDGAGSAPSNPPAGQGGTAGSGDAGQGGGSDSLAGGHGGASGEGQGGEAGGDAGTGGVGGVALACPHDACNTGAPLSKGCSPCVQKVCAKEPSCCEQAWSTDCVLVALSITSCACNAAGGL